MLLVSLIQQCYLLSVVVCAAVADDIAVFYLLLVLCSRDWLKYKARPRRKKRPVAPRGLH